MGTRHLQTVINKEGDIKLRQYGQWDGYPSGQGVEILQFLHSVNLETYNTELSKLRQPTEEEELIIEADDKWKENYPYLSRDCGSRIHKMIEDGDVKFVYLQDDECLKYCEGVYTIDLQKNIFIAEFHDTKKIYKLDKLPTIKKLKKDFK